MHRMIIFIMLFVSCKNPSKPDFEKERSEILHLEASQREYHFEKKAKEFSELASDSFISVNRGLISMPSKQSSYERYNKCFNAVEFIKWDDKTEPLIRFSDDASVAYVVVNKEVILKLKDDNGAPVMDTTHFAWLTVYKKGNTGWEIDCVASTNQ